MSDYHEPEKKVDPSEKDDNPYSGLRKKDKVRTLQTFLRNSYRSHYSMFSIADRKANIMLRLNSFLLSVALIFHKNILNFEDLGAVTLVLFLLTTLVSLTLAALAARPVKVDNQNIIKYSPETIAKNLFFNMYLSKIEQPEYEKAFGIMMEDTELIIGNMSRELYHLRTILIYKYRLLRHSYSVFLYGFILTLGSFFINILDII